MKKTIVITGASRGIGLALARHYHALGEHVIAVCRQASDALNHLGVEVVAGVDVADPEAIKSLAQALNGVSIDVLINNAGVWGSERLGQINYANLDKVMQINAIAPLRITESLLTGFKSGSKIALITSRMGSIDDNGSGGSYDYRMSKAALNMAGKSLSVDLHATGVAVGIFHPGFVQTDMVGGRGDISAEQAAQRLAARIEALNLDNSGGFWHSNGERLPW